MNFETMDHDEVVIDFVYHSDDNWSIYSVWQEFESSEYISTLPLINSVKQFLRELNDALHDINYVVTLDEYLL
jgi:hypothetical protein